MPDPRIRLLQGDITTVEADAIVNAANSSLMGGGGVDGAIHRRGGPEILEACKAIVARQGRLPAGEAVITTAGRLPARYVIHTVGPVWSDSEPEAKDRLLANCYRNSLELAKEQGLHTIAFPNISTGVYGYPKDRAAPIAVQAVADFLATDEQLTEVLFVCFDEENARLYAGLLGESR